MPNIKTFGIEWCTSAYMPKEIQWIRYESPLSVTANLPTVVDYDELIAGIAYSGGNP